MMIDYDIMTIVTTSFEVKLPILLGNYDRQTNKPDHQPTILTKQYALNVFLSAFSPA